MRGEEQTIEVEVVEIDGVSLSPKVEQKEAAKGAPWARWGNWQGQVKQLDMRWLPLWLALGFFALVVAVAVGMCVAVFVVAWRILKGLLNGIANLLFSSGELRR